MLVSLRKFLKVHWPIIVLILVNIMIGLVIVRDYGISWDEPRNYRYAYQTLENYVRLFHGLPVTEFIEGNLDLKGPAYFMAAGLFSRLVTSLLPSWSEINGWHLASFLSFQIGIISFYFLACRWMGKWAAFGATLLFTTQPVLWGHAFINQKDIPFMAFFLASVTSGLYMVDAVEPLSISRETWDSLVRNWRVEWDGTAQRIKKATIAVFAVFILSVLMIITGLSQKFVAAMVTYVYQVDKQSFIGAWFARAASNADRISVGNYIHKAQVIFSNVEIIYILVFVVTGLLVLVRLFPLAYESAVKNYLAPYIKRLVLNPIFLIAALTLGIVTSIRVLGPFAGGIVILYGIYKSWKKSILFIPPYLLIAGLTTYLTWPYLWGNAIRRFIESLSAMSEYPWDGVVLFQGKLLTSNEIPSYYVPFTMSIQLTEITLILFGIGFFISIWRALKQNQVEPLALFLIWFILPIFAVIAKESVIYNNFRQFLFILPPIFLLSGLTLDSLFKKLRKVALRIAILLLFVIPAIYTDVRLHPYQYIYYNSFIGGVRGAFRNYDLDYWGTSYYEAATYINQVATPGARIVVSGPIHLFQQYVRSDLITNVPSDVSPAEHYDYVVVNETKNEDYVICKDITAVKLIERNGAVLTSIKVPPVTQEGCP